MFKLTCYYKVSRFWREYSFCTCLLLFIFSRLLEFYFSWKYATLTHRWFDSRYVKWKKQQKLNNEMKNNLKNGGPQGAQNSKERKFWNSGSLYVLIDSHFDLIEKRPLFILTGLHRPHSLDSRGFYCSWKGATLTRKQKWKIRLPPWLVYGQE